MSDGNKNLKDESSSNNDKPDPFKFNQPSLNEKTNDVLARFNQLKPMKLEFTLDPQKEQEESLAMRKQMLIKTRPKDNPVNQPQDSSFQGFPSEYYSQPSQPQNFKKDPQE